jgi:Uma2 family endonuclease
MLGKGANSNDSTREKMIPAYSMAARMFAHAHGHTIGENQRMQMATRQQWTRADLERMPDDGNQYEVVRGELFVTPAPAVWHQRLVLVLSRILRRYVEPIGLGEVDQAPSAIVFEDSEVQPDIVVRKEPVSLPKTWAEMPIPFLVVEILSDSTRRRDLVEKRSLYIDAGVTEYWIVDDRTRSIRVVRDDVDQVSTDMLQWRPAGSPEPLVLDVAAVFRDALG